MGALAVCNLELFLSFRNFYQVVNGELETWTFVKEPYPLPLVTKRRGDQ